MNKKIYNTLFRIIPLLTILIMVSANCSTLSVHRREGLSMNRAGNYDEAVEYFEKTLEKYPRKSELRTMLFRAKLNSYYYHLALARKLREEEKKDDAVKEYKLALKVFPGNKKITDELNDYIGVKKKEKPVFKSNIQPPVTLQLASNEKITLNLKNTPIVKIFKMVGKSYGVNFIFDKDFRDFVYTIEIEEIGFYDVLNQLCMVGNAKHRVLDSSSVLIYPNTTFKNRSFGLKGVKVFYLNNTKAEDTKKLIMMVFRDQGVMMQEDANLNCIIVKAPANTLREIERFLGAIDKMKSEVELDVEILELNRNVINSIGLDYQDTLSSLSIGTVKETVDSSSNTSVTIEPLTSFNNIGKSNFFLTLPSPAVNLLESDGDTKIISKPNLRVVDGEEVKFMVGDEIPIPRTQFAASAAGAGVNNIPVTSYEYKSVGVDVKLTPTIHRNHDVTLKIKLKLDFITGSVNDFPTFGKREMETVIRLKEGETSIIGGLIKDEVRGSLKGFPGLARLPILGRLFGNASKDQTQTDLVFSITPRIVRWIDISEQDQAAIWADAETDHGSAGSSGSERQLSGELDPEDQRKPDRKGASAIIITPRKRKIPVNSISHFTLRLNSSQEISSLSVSGSLSGGKAEIQELKTDFFGGKDDVKVLNNVSGDSFDIGYTFTGKPIRSSVVGQLKIKFLEKGNYTISIGSVNAVTKDQKPVEVSTTTSEIEVH